MSLYYYVSTLSVYGQTVTSDTALIGVFLSMYGLWQAVLRIPLGIVADWIGRRKPFIIAGFLFATLGAWMMASAGNITGLVNGRAMTGFAAGHLGSAGGRLQQLLPPPKKPSAPPP